MIFTLSALGVALVALLPLGLGALLHQKIRLRRDMALQLHRAQLSELDRDLSLGRLPQIEYAAAKLEIERRLLASAALADLPTKLSGAWVVVALAIAVPAGAYGLYRIQGHPESVGIAPPPRPSAQELSDEQKDADMAKRLRTVLAHVEPGSGKALEGYRLLGNVEAARGNLDGALEAWQSLLAIRFEPQIAAAVGELLTHKNDGKATPEAVALWRRALGEGPADAPWRKLVEKSLAEAPPEALKNDK